MENFVSRYACSPFVLSEGARAHGMTAGTWTASGRGLGMTGGTRVTAPLAIQVQGTTVSIASDLVVAREKTVAFPKAAATALLPNSDVVVDDIAGIRTWSPPV